jgi:hypothetical protein
MSKYDRPVVGCSRRTFSRKDFERAVTRSWMGSEEVERRKRNFAETKDQDYKRVKAQIVLV